MGRKNDTLAAARQRLEGRQMRFTRARRLVIELLEETAGPLSAGDLVEAIEGAIPVSSLYRTLSILEESGLITRFPDQSGLARYELAEWLSGHHHHLTCAVCGATSDVPVPRDLEATLTDIAAEVGRRFAFGVTGHRLDLQGVCTRCR